jgi:hypothetical protein
MVSQIFKYPLPPNILFDFLEETCVKTDKYYVFDKCALKKASYKNLIHTFYATLVDYYHSSKHKYLENPTNYNSMCTIIRQICKLNTLSCVSNIKYSNSTYEIIYFIYYV